MERVKLGLFTIAKKIESGEAVDSVLVRSLAARPPLLYFVSLYCYSILLIFLVEEHRLNGNMFAENFFPRGDS